MDNKNGVIITIIITLLIIPFSYAGWFAPLSPPPSPGPAGPVGPQGPPGPPGNYTAGDGIIIDPYGVLSVNTSFLSNLYNDTALIYAVNTTSNIESLGFNTTADLESYFNTLYYSITNPDNYINQSTTDDLYYSITNPDNYINQSTTDSLYYSITNPEGYINGTYANGTYLLITDQRYNETQLINDINLSLTTNYYTKNESNNTFYPLNSNPTNYLNTTTLGNVTGIFVRIPGDTMTGSLNMSNNNITDVDVLYVHNISGRSPIGLMTDMVSNNSITAGTFYGNIQGTNGTIYGMTITNGTITNMHVIDSAIFNTSLIPELNNTWSLGNLTNQWKDFYVNNLIATNITSPSLNYVKIPGDNMTGNLNMTGNNIYGVNELEAYNTTGHTAYYDGNVSVNDTVRARYYGSFSPITFVDEFGQPIAQISTNSTIGNGTWGYIRAYEIIVDRLSILGLLNYSAVEPPDYYFAGAPYLYKVGGNGTYTFYLNETYLNQTIFSSQTNVTQQQIKDLGFNITSELTALYNTLYYDINNPNNYINQTQADALYYPLNSNPRNYINDTTTININYSQINNTPNLSQYLIDVTSNDNYIIVTGSNNKTLSLNESYLNNTINNISKVRKLTYNMTCTAVSGSCNVTSGINISYQITQIKVIPTTITNKYKFQLTEYPITTNIIDRDLAQHTGIWDIQKSYAINGQVQGSISNALIDELFTIQIIYLYNGVV